MKKSSNKLLIVMSVVLIVVSIILITLGFILSGSKTYPENKNNVSEDVCVVGDSCA